MLKTAGGQQISQTTTIIRYVAAELGLYGKNHLERAFMDTVIVSNKEMHDEYRQINFLILDELERVSVYFTLDNTDNNNNNKALTTPKSEIV